MFNRDKAIRAIRKALDYAANRGCGFLLDSEKLPDFEEFNDSIKEEICKLRDSVTDNSDFIALLTDLDAIMEHIKTKGYSDWATRNLKAARVPIVRLLRKVPTTKVHIKIDGFTLTLSRKAFARLLQAADFSYDGGDMADSYREDSDENDDAESYAEEANNATAIARESLTVCRNLLEKAVSPDDDFSYYRVKVSYKGR